ncbi:MAG: hypothetical protein PVH61_15725 [Candidatus Aminicenantes bacterium]|jgi:hypothetical protein
MKEKENYKVRGVATSDHNRRGVSKLRLKAWDKALASDDFSGIAKKDGIMKPNSHRAIYRKKSIFWKVENGLASGVRVLLTSPNRLRPISFISEGLLIGGKLWQNV